MKSNWLRPLAIVLLALVLTTPFWLGLRRLDAPPLDSRQVLAFLPDGPFLLRDLDPGWAENRWQPSSEASASSQTTTAFRLGVRLLDLATALRAADLEAARQIVRRVEELLPKLESPPGAQLSTRRVREILESTDPDFGEARRGLEDLESELDAIASPTALWVGKWAGAGHAALLAEAEIFFKSRHWAAGLDLLSTPDTDPRLAGLAAELRATFSGDLTGLRSRLDEITELLASGELTVAP